MTNPQPSAYRGRLAISLVIGLVCSPSAASAQAVKSTRLAKVTPESAGMDSATLSRIDTVVAEGLRRKLMPGAVILVARQRQIVFLKAYGSRAVQPEVEPMTVSTVFDMASITKPMATATSVMKLVEQGKVDLDAPVANYIPEFAANEKGHVTVRQLLTHQGGLIPDNSIRDYRDGPKSAMQRVYNLKFYVPPTTKFVYTDVGFIVLADLVKRVSDQDVHEFSQTHIFGPLGMKETGYQPPTELADRAAPTEKIDDKWRRGVVHDPRAFALGGIAGHAGLFSTAEDIAIYAAMMKNNGAVNGIRILKPETVREMTAAYKIADGNQRGLGWDKQTGYSYNKGDLLSPAAFGHGGFTGTVLWMDPELDLTFVFLSNRVHPNGKGSVNRLAGRIATLAAAAIKNRTTGVARHRE